MTVAVLRKLDGPARAARAIHNLGTIIRWGNSESDWSYPLDYGDGEEANLANIIRRETAYNAARKLAEMVINAPQDKRAGSGFYLVTGAMVNKAREVLSLNEEEEAKRHDN